MLYNVVLLVISFLLFSYAFSEGVGRKEKGVLFFLAFSLLPAKFFLEKLWKEYDISQAHEAAKIESESNLEDVLSGYSNIDSDAVREAREKSVIIYEEPMKILELAASISLENDGFRFDEDTLRKIFYLVSWVESDYRKYDAFFRGDNFERRKIRWDEDFDDWVEVLRESDGFYYRSDVDISFGEYDFEEQSFDVRFSSAPQYVSDGATSGYIGSGFSEGDIESINANSKEHEHVGFNPIRVSLFNDGRDRADGAVRTGDSVFSTVFPDVESPHLSVNEEVASDLDVGEFTMFATAYFDIRDSKLRLHTKWTANLICDFVDIYRTEKRQEVYKTIDCDDLNKDVGYVSFR